MPKAKQFYVPKPTKRDQVNKVPLENIALTTLQIWQATDGWCLSASQGEDNLIACGHYDNGSSYLRVCTTEEE